MNCSLSKKQNNKFPIYNMYATLKVYNRVTVQNVKNSEYDQEIPQSQTADKQTRGIVRKSHTTITRHQEDKQSKATSSLFPIEMIAELEWTQSNAQPNIGQLKNPTMGETKITNHKQQNHRLRTDSSQTHWGGLHAFYWYQIFILDSAVVEAQKILSLHGGFLTIAVYHHRETM